MGGWVYFTSNRKNGTLYVGVTSDPARRIHEHQTGMIAGFTRQYGLKRLVHIEPHETMPLAIQREKVIKGWPRAWKVRLINEHNPEWKDLYERLI